MPPFDVRSVEKIEQRYLRDRAEFAEMTASITQFHCRAEVKTAPNGRVTPRILSNLHGLCSVRKHNENSCTIQDMNSNLDRVLSARCFSSQKVIKHLLKPISRLQKVLQNFCSISNPEMFQEKLFSSHFRNSGNDFCVRLEILFYFCSVSVRLQFPSWQASCRPFAGWQVRLPIKQATLKVICYPLCRFFKFG